MKASLPMYDPPELHRGVDAWWRGIADAFRAEGVDDVPDQLDRAVPVEELWRAPDLLFAQACGYPLLGAWAGHLQYLVTPRYAAPGCEGTNYCSWIVVPANSPAKSIEDLRGARCSINGRISHSGYNALRALVAPLARDGAFFGSVRVSGGHAASLAEVARGDADVASIDCVTYALLSRCRPHVVGATRIIGRTPPAPGLPYVTGIDRSPELRERLCEGLRHAFADAALANVRAELLIDGFDVLPVEQYRCMIDMEHDARRRRYVELD
jgi:ABC-type phosphate/phosphonate transport system substrate-binding protein